MEVLEEQGDLLSKNNDMLRNCSRGSTHNSSRLILFLALAFAAVVVVFATINWFVFQRNSTSFLISEQMNKRLERYDLISDGFNLADFHIGSNVILPVSVDEFNKVIEPNLHRISALNDSLEVCQRDLVKCEAQIDSIGLVIDKEREIAISAYKDKALSEIQSRLDSLQLCMVGDSTELVLNGSFVLQAQLQLERARKEAAIYDYIQHNYGSFAPAIDLNKFNCLLSDRVHLMVIADSLQMRRKDEVRKYKDLVKCFHENRSSTCSFGDFLYYSLCVGTTVSFGDIAPNNSCTRALAALEILICICIIGVFLDRLSKKFNYFRGENRSL